jgi:hypothetical protein
MKKIILAISILFSLSASGQSDSTAIADSIQMSHANEPITVKLPVKAIVLYAYYFQRNFDWSNRLAPDGYKGLIGSGTHPDSLVTVTVAAKNLSDFIDNVYGERYGAISTYAQSVFNNTPAISGYTALFTQVINTSNGNTSQKNAANYMIWRYNRYTGNLTNMINDYYTKGLDWIQH